MYELTDAQVEAILDSAPDNNDDAGIAAELDEAGLLVTDTSWWTATGDIICFIGDGELVYADEPLHQVAAQ